MNGQLWNTIEPSFGYLMRDYGFERVKESYDREHFGNAILILQSKDFRIRFIRDRGQVFVEVGSLQMTEEWHLLNRVLEFLGGKFKSDDLSVLGSELKSRYPQVRDLFKEQNYFQIKMRLRELEESKTKNIFRHFI